MRRSRLVKGVAVLLLAPLVWVRVTRIAVDASRASATLVRTSPEQRRVSAYGDCSGMGYGYLRRVLEGIPDSTLRPLVRYPDWNRRGTVVLPTAAWRDDPRVLVGIELTPADLQPVEVAATPRLELNRGAASAWAFQTGFDYDLMSGLRIGSSVSSSDRLVTATLYSQVDRRTRLAAATATVTAFSASTLVRFDPPLTGVLSQSGRHGLLD